MDWTLGFVGAGVMAEVMIAGLLEEGVLPPDRIIASNRRQKRSTELHARYGIETTQDNRVVAGQVDVLVLSVKPQSLGVVLRELQGQIPADSLVLSIIAALIALIMPALGAARATAAAACAGCRHRTSPGPPAPPRRRGTPRG